MRSDLVSVLLATCLTGSRLAQCGCAGSDTLLICSRANYLFADLSYECGPAPNDGILILSSNLDRDSSLIITTTWTQANFMNPFRQATITPASSRCSSIFYAPPNPSTLACFSKIQRVSIVTLCFSLRHQQLRCRSRLGSTIVLVETSR